MIIAKTRICGPREFMPGFTRWLPREKRVLHEIYLRSSHLPCLPLNNRNNCAFNQFKSIGGRIVIPYRPPFLATKKLLDCRVPHFLLSLLRKLFEYEADGICTRVLSYFVLASQMPSPSYFRDTSSG